MKKNLVIGMLMLIMPCISFAAAFQESTFEKLMRLGFVDESQEETLRLFTQSLSALKSGDHTRAKEIAFECARRGLLQGVHYLGTVADDNFEKAQWFSLATQISWVNTGRNYQPSLAMLKALVPAKMPAKLKVGTLPYFVLNSLRNYYEFESQQKSVGARVHALIRLLQDVYPNNRNGLITHAFFILRAVSVEDSLAKLSGIIQLGQRVCVVDEEDNFFKLGSARIFASIVRHANADVAQQARVILEQTLRGLIQSLFVEKPSYTDEEHGTFAELYDWMTMLGEYEVFLNVRGLFLAKKLVFPEMGDQERYREAAKLFQMAETDPDAAENLAYLYYEDRIGQELTRGDQLRKVISLYGKSTSLKARKNRMSAHVALFNLTLDVDQLREARSELLSLVSERSEDAGLHLALAQISVDLFTFGGADPSWLDQAEIYARRAYELGELHAADLLLIELNEMRLADRASLGDDVAQVDVVDWSADLGDESSDSDQEEKVLLPGPVEDLASTLPLPSSSVSSSSSSSGRSAPEVLKITRTKTRKAEKKLRATRRKQEQSTLLSPIAATIEGIGSASVRNLELVFLDAAVEAQFANLDQQKKMNEIFDDIIRKPWATEGSGKPEVLRFGKFKGCISRRLDHEHRLVYRVIGTNKIKIMSCKGHY